MGFRKDIRIYVTFPCTDAFKELEQLTITDDKKTSLISKLPVPETVGLSGWSFCLNHQCPGYVDDGRVSYYKPERPCKYIVHMFELSWYGYFGISQEDIKSATDTLLEFVIDELAEVITDQKLISEMHITKNNMPSFSILFPSVEAVEAVA